MTSDVYLVPVGANRYELYAEPIDHVETPAKGRLARMLRQARAQWAAAVEAARDGTTDRSRIARWRDRVLCHLAESAAEHRAISGLRHVVHATVVFPPELGDTQALALTRTLLERARGHHRLWLAIDAAALVVSGFLAPLPGPNLVAYYFAFRVYGHYSSWSGARRALARVSWTARGDAALDELGRLVAVPCEARDAEVEAIAARLALPRLPRFFRRAAVSEP